MKMFSQLENKKIYMIGLGVSHIDLARLFVKKGFDLTICDKATPEKLGEIYEELSQAGVKFLLKEKYLDSLCDADIVFRSPGMYYLNEKLQQAREYGVVVTSEMEMFFDLCPCKIYAVTGSDGKTTTTSIIAEMLKAQGKKVYLGGNIGKALLPTVEEMTQEDVAVVELSSFQLLSMRKSPDVAVITNISPNHLDVHKDMEEYIGSKCNLIAHQNAFSKTVLNADNVATMKLKPLVRGVLSTFSRKIKVDCGVCLNEKDEIIYINKKQGKEILIMKASDIKLPGLHNVENYIAASSACIDEVDVENIVNVATEFGGVEHRIEYVRTINGVRYYNDSIATSPTRTIAGLNSFSQKLIVIAGGYDKNIPYEPIAAPIVERVKVLILLGKTAPKIQKVVEEQDGFAQSGLKIINVATLEEAVECAKNIAQIGDVITLSPASASFDLYKNFEERGNHFKSIVKQIDSSK